MVSGTRSGTPQPCGCGRSCLLTGRNHTRNSMACITEGARGSRTPAARSRPRTACCPRFSASGLEHLHGGQMAPVPHRRDEPRLDPPQLAHRARLRTVVRLPRRRDKSVVPGAHLRQPSGGPAEDAGEGYHFSEDITDKAIEFIMDAKAVAPQKPFFLYYAPGACHAPHHAPKEWIEKYKGQFDMGYEAMREETLARQKQMGIVPANTELPPVNPIGTPETRQGPEGQPFPPLDVTRPWDTLSDDEERLFARMAEVYAGFLGHPDLQIGRLLDYLEQTGQRENTQIMVVSDNGASGEGGPDGSVNEMKFMNGIPDDMAASLAMLDDLGGPKTYNHYPNRWARAFNPPC